jgi:hypothetical protein
MCGLAPWRDEAILLGGGVMGEGTYENGGLLRYRVNRNSDRLDAFEKWKSEVDIERATVKQQLTGIREDVHDIAGEVKGFRRMAFAVLISCSTAIVVFALNILAGTGRI